MTLWSLEQIQNYDIYINAIVCFKFVFSSSLLQIQIDYTYRTNCWLNLAQILKKTLSELLIETFICVDKLYFNTR